MEYLKIKYIFASENNERVVRTEKKISKKELKKSNKEYKQTIIMITHNMEIAKCADRIIKIEDGKIVKGE